MLDADYVSLLLMRLANEGQPRLHSLAVATAAFRTLGARPEELLRALRGLAANTRTGGAPDVFLPVIAATLRSTAADIELMKVEQLGVLAMAVFERVAVAEAEARGLFSADALAHYCALVDREVRVDEVQTVPGELMIANIVVRQAHGLYRVTDPFVQETWRERKALVQ